MVFPVVVATPAPLFFLGLATGFWYGGLAEGKREVAREVVDVEEGVGGRVGCGFVPAM